MATQSKDIARYNRYARVVDAILEQAEFALPEIKHVCSEEKPAFVTLVVKGLEKDGILQRGTVDSEPTFHWQVDRELFSASQWLDRQIYGTRITRTPVAERPRERLLADGAAKMRNADLLAILVRSGRPGESALSAGEKVANRYADCLEKLPDAGRGELKSISHAIDVTAYCQIMAGIELGRRVAAASNQREALAKIGGSKDAVDFCRSAFSRLAADGAQEEFHIVTLNTKNQVIATHQISVGLVDQSVAHPREVFRPAIKDAAKSIILVHNHPSGNPTPSQQDLNLTRRLEEAGRTVGIEVLDHIIVARDGTTSIREYHGSNRIQ